MIRVDIMQSDSGEMVVNELESLEATHYPTSGKQKEYRELNAGLVEQFFSVLVTCADEVVNESRKQLY